MLSPQSPDLSVPRRHGELHVAVRDVGLTVVEAAATKKLFTDSGERSVAAHDQVGLDLGPGPVGPEERQGRLH